MFSNNTAQFYDFFRNDPGDGTEEADFISSFLPAGGSILEIGAGVGRAAAGLAIGGFRVTALEPDPQMYAAMLVRLALQPVARERVTALPKGFGFSLEESFDACTAFAIFHILDAPQRDSLFKYAARQLKSGGLFFVESFPELASRTDAPRELMASCQYGGVTYEWHGSRSRTATGTWRMHWEYNSHFGQSNLQSSATSYEWTTCGLTDLAALANRTGFELEHVYSEFNKQPYVEGTSGSLVALLRKKAP